MPDQKPDSEWEKMRKGLNKIWRKIYEDFLDEVEQMEKDEKT